MNFMKCADFIVLRYSLQSFAVLFANTHLCRKPQHNRYSVVCSVVKMKFFNKD